MSKQSYILSMDLGTTGNRVFCFDEKGVPISSAYREFRQIFPKPGWVEHDPEEIWNSVLSLIDEAIEKGNLVKDDIISIGITNQRETTVIWDSKTGKPVYNAIVWQCRRTAHICEDIKSAGMEDRIREITGLVVDPYFSATKIRWILDNAENSKSLEKSGRLRFGTIDTWILWKLTGGRSHMTDYTNASRTMLFDIRKKEWAAEICDYLEISKSLLPSVQESSSDFGKTSECGVLPDGIIIGGIAGDQQAAMTGQGRVFRGAVKNTYGTGSFILMNTGRDFSLSQNGLLTTLSPDDAGGWSYALEGSIFVTGAVVQWLRDEMNFFNSAHESEYLAESVEADDEIVFVPAFVGLGAPYWDMNARGAIFGLTRDTTKSQITRAALKSIALQSRDIMELMIGETGLSIDKLRVDGGATDNSYLMQYQADILNIPVSVPQLRESTALGAAYLAGLTAGLYSSITEISQFNSELRLYTPRMEEEKRQREINLWTKTVKKLIG